jgi:hypothetical protein
MKEPLNSLNMNRRHRFRFKELDVFERWIQCQRLLLAPADEQDC